MRELQLEQEQRVKDLLRAEKDIEMDITKLTQIRGDREHVPSIGLHEICEFPVHRCMLSFQRIVLPDRDEENTNCYLIFRFKYSQGDV
jgi:hypothetical protein